MNFLFDSGPISRLVNGDIFIVTIYSSWNAEGGKFTLDFEGSNDHPSSPMGGSSVMFDGPNYDNYETNIVPVRIPYSFTPRANQLSSFVFSTQGYFSESNYYILNLTSQFSFPDASCNNNLRIYSNIYNGYMLEQL